MLAAAFLPLLLLAVPTTGRPVVGDSPAVDDTCGRGGRRYRWRNRTSTSIVPLASSTSIELPISSASATVSPNPPGAVLIVATSTTAQTTAAAATTPAAPVVAPPPASSSAAPAPPPAPALAPAPAPAPAAGGAPAGDSTTLLNLHNDFRRNYGANPLKWNADLAKFAQDYGSKCVFKHSGGPYGENLAAGSGSGYTATSGFNAWANEASQYNWNSPGFAAGTGHFTQVVWKATTELGCTVVQCGGDTIFSQKSSYVICEYKTGGNMVGNNGQYFRENVGTLQG